MMQPVQFALLVCVVVLSAWDLTAGKVSTVGSNPQLFKDVGFDGQSNWGTRSMVSLGIVTKITDDEENTSDKFTFQPRCLGMVIQSKYPMLILTAAHCVYYKTINYKWSDHAQYYAVIDYDGTNFDNAKFARVLDAEYPASYTSNQRHMFGDIAVIRVHFDGEFGNGLANVMPARLPLIGEVNEKFRVNPGEFADLDSDDTNVNIYGWDEYPRVKRTTVKPLSRERCRQIFVAGENSPDGVYPWVGSDGTLNYTWMDGLDSVMQNKLRHDYNLTRLVKTDEICALDTDFEQSNCHGDSGGPMLDGWGNTQRANVFGVASSGLAKVGCDPKYPVIFTSTSVYRRWILGARGCLMLKYYEWLKEDLNRAIEMNNQLCDVQINRIFEYDNTMNAAYYNRFKSAYATRLTARIEEIENEELDISKARCNRMNQENARQLEINEMPVGQRNTQNFIVYD